MTAEPTGTRPVRPLEELLDATDAPPTVERLEALVREVTVALGPFTDEELHWLSDDEAVAVDELDAPRLSTLSPDARAAALDATLVLLLARGDLTIEEPDGGASLDAGGDPDVRPTGRHALITQLREAPLGMARVRTEDRDGAASLAAVYHVTDELFLLEDVDPAGVHAFWLADTAHSAGWLAGHLDPLRRADASTEPVVAPRVEDLGAGPTRELAGAELLTEVDVARAEHDQPQVSAVSLWTLPDGLAAVRLTGRDDHEASYQRLEAAGVDELALACVTALRPRGVDAPRG